jgi:hypothetical protein
VSNARRATVGAVLLCMLFSACAEEPQEQDWSVRRLNNGRVKISCARNIEVCADIALNRCPDGYVVEDRGGGVEGERSVSYGLHVTDTENDFHGYMVVRCKDP